MNNFEKFKSSYDESIAAIDEYRRCDNMKSIAAWLMQTSVNPYTFLDNYTASTVHTAEGMYSLLSLIHHAIIDDGSITFIVIDGSPKIKFNERWEISVPKKEIPKLSKDAFGKQTIVKMLVEPNIEYLKDFSEFIECIENYNRRLERYYFYCDAYSYGLDYSIEKYSAGEFYDKKWEKLEDTDDEKIESHTKLLKMKKAARDIELEKEAKQKMWKAYFEKIGAPHTPYTNSHNSFALDIEGTYTYDFVSVNGIPFRVEVLSDSISFTICISRNSYTERLSSGVRRTIFSGLGHVEYTHPDYAIILSARYMNTYDLGNITKTEMHRRYSDAFINLHDSLISM